MSVQENVSITVLDQVKTAGVHISGRRERRMVADAISSVGLSESRISSRVGDLSGGNQQKAVIAKWIASGVRILIIDEPTVGVDVGSKEDIYAVIRQLAADDTAILLITSELEEVVRLSDRVGVMVDGVLRSVLPNSHSYAEMSDVIMHEITRVHEPEPA
jgi:ribose transport system ATP-binding protein